MNIWVIGKKLIIIKKEIFYSHLNMKNIADTNGTHTNKVLK